MPASAATSDRSTSSRLPSLGWGVRVAGTLVFLALIAVRLDPSAIASTWRGLSPVGLGSALAAFNLAMAVRVVKWRWQVRRLRLLADPLALSRDLLLGVLLGGVTPARLGELYRLRPFAAESRAVAAASLVLEKVYELTVLFAFVALGLAVSRPALGVLLIGALAVSAGWTIGGLRAPKAVLRRLPSRLRDGVVLPALRARDGLGVDGRVGVLVLTVAAHTLNLVGAVQVYGAFGPVDLWTLAVRLPLVTLSSALPFSVGGLGVREATAMAALGDGVLPASAAAVAASVVFLAANLLPAAVGLGLLSIARVSRTS